MASNDVASRIRQALTDGQDWEISYLALLTTTFRPAVMRRITAGPHASSHGYGHLTKPSTQRYDHLTKPSYHA